MSFKNNNYFKHESQGDISKWCEIEDLSDDVKQGKFNSDVNRAWSVIRHWTSGDESHYYVTLDKNNEYEIYDHEGNDLFPHSFNGAPIIRAIEIWDIKHQLSPKALKTFEELIDEL